MTVEKFSVAVWVSEDTTSLVAAMESIEEICPIADVTFYHSSEDETLPSLLAEFSDKLAIEIEVTPSPVYPAHTPQLIQADWHVLGLSLDEILRVEELRKLSDNRLLPILVNKNMTTEDCQAAFNRVFQE